jgi:hypothetical protein
MAKRQVSDGLAAPNSRDEALEKIMRQENQLNAQIQALRDEARLQTERHGPTSGSALTEKPGNSIEPAPAPPSLTPQDRKKQRQAAVQEAWIERLTGAKAKESATFDNAGPGAQARPLQQAQSVNRGFVFSYEQLAEAAEFAKSATDAIKRPARRTIKSKATKDTKVMPMKSTRLSLPNAQKVPNSARTIPLGRPGQAVLEAKNAVRALDPRPADLNFNFGKAPSNSVPPHLRKLNAAKAAKDAAQTNSGTDTSAFGSPLPSIADAAESGRPVWPMNDRMPTSDPTSFEREEDDLYSLTLPRNPSVYSQTPAIASTNMYALLEKVSDHSKESKCDMQTAGDGQHNVRRVASAVEEEITKGKRKGARNGREEEEERLERERQERLSALLDSGYKRWQRGATSAPPRRPSFEQLLHIDDGSQGRYLLDQKEDEGEPAGFNHESASSIKVAECAMSGLGTSIHTSSPPEPRLVSFKPFFDEDHNRLLNAACSIEDMTAEEREMHWITMSREKDHHTAKEWKLYYERVARPAYITKSKSVEGASTTSPKTGPTAGNTLTDQDCHAEKVEELKSVVTSSKQGNVDRRHDLRPGSLIAKIERANRIISGKEDSLPSSNSSRAERVGKDEKSNRHFGGVSSRGWERYDEMPNAAESSDSEDDESSQDALAHNSQDDEVRHDATESADRGSTQASALHPQAMEPILSDPAQNSSDKVETSPDKDGSETTNVTTRTPRVPLLSLQPNTDPRLSSRSRERMSVLKQMVDGSQSNNRGSNGSSTSCVGHHKDDLRGLDFSIGSQVGSPVKQSARAPQAPTAKASLQATVLPSAPFGAQPGSNETQTKKSTTSTSMPTQVASNTMHMGHPQTSFQYPAMQTTPGVASTTTRPLVYPNLMGVEQCRTDTIRQLPVQHGNASGIMNYTHPAVNAPNAAFRSTSGYGTAYGNQYDTLMPDWAAGLFQNHVQTPYPQFGHRNYTNFTDGQFSAFQHAEVSAPAAAVQTPVKPKSISKGVAITKPPEEKYNEEYPSLPSKKSVDPEPKLLPPPGFRGSHGADKNTFDALLSKGADVVGAKVEKTTAVATCNPFDALLSSTDGVSDGASTNPDNTKRDSVVDVGTNDSETGPKAIQKKRKPARAALTKAWEEREMIRKRIVGTYTLDGARALEYATRTYNDKRMELAGCMASGELRDEDKKMFPYLSFSDLSVPKLRPADVQRSAA